MNGSFRGLAAILLLGAASPQVVQAVEDDMCDVIHQCPNGCYTAAWPTAMITGPFSCDQEVQDLVFRKVQNHLPPSPVGLTCENLGGSFLCEAWPQGNGMTYSWDVSPGLYLPNTGNPGNPFVSVICSWTGGGNWVSVTVTSPSGTTDSKMVPVGFCNVN